MASAAQITANQQNSQMSTGPRTEAGKQTVSRNALVHGLAAKKLFLSPEDKLAFEELRNALLDHYAPATAHERNLVEDLAEARWRRRVAHVMENSFLELAIAEQRKADRSLTIDQALARVFMDDNLQKRMRLMMRYLESAGRATDKARHELESVIAARRAEEQRRAELRAFLAATAPPATPQPQSPAPVPGPANRVCSVAPQRC